MNRRPAAARIVARVTPRAARNEIGGVDPGGVVHVRVSASPTDGKANAAASQLLAKALGVPPSRVRMVAGARSRTKTFEIEGIDAAEVARTLSIGSRRP